MSQEKLNQIVKLLQLSKQEAVILWERIERKQFACSQNNICQRKREYAQCFKTENNISFCTNVSGLLDIIMEEVDPSNWFLFMDSVSKLLKAVLTKSQNLKAILVAYSKDSKNRED